MVYDSAVRILYMKLVTDLLALSVFGSRHIFCTIFIFRVKGAENFVFLTNREKQFFGIVRFSPPSSFRQSFSYHILPKSVISRKEGMVSTIVMRERGEALDSGIKMSLLTIVCPSSCLRKRTSGR